jgi:hypothetical protein
MAEAALAKVETAALARPAEDIGISIEQIIARVDKIREVRKRVMKADVHYGKVPGTDKDTLLKPGAETLCMAFQLAPHFKLDERWDGSHLEVVVTCVLVHVPSGTELGNAVGSCSTLESKYAYRKGSRLCTECGKATLIKGKPEYEREERFKGGWLCYAKKGGCGAKFVPGDPKIEGQQTDRVENPDIADQYNTVRKMACKRAHVAATLFVTGASELFTQDVEDTDGGGDAPSEPEPKAAPVTAVASEKDLADVLAAHAECTSAAELEAVSRAHRNRKWSRAQVATLRADYAKCEAALKAPPPSADDDGREYDHGSTGEQP